jgi:hypothetical protein
MLPKESCFQVLFFNDFYFFFINIGLNGVYLTPVGIFDA